MHEEPPRLDDAGWLAPVLEHTMARDPADRWSMAQVRDFLDQGRAVTIHPAPFGTVDDDGTRVLQPTPSEPVAVPPVVADPALVDGDRRRRPVDPGGGGAGRSGPGSRPWCCWSPSRCSASRR